MMFRYDLEGAYCVCRTHAPTRLESPRGQGKSPGQRGGVKTSAQISVTPFLLVKESIDCHLDLP